ncbi:MAG: hypothetical protein Q9191_007577 [Dirinaria sp. TL-2023a]
MLNSLNPDHPRLSSPTSAKPPRSAGSQLSSTRSLRHRGHLPSSSSASDTTFTIGESTSRLASQLTRGRRSNSSSTFQSTLGRTDSARPNEDHGPTRRSNALNSQRTGTNDRFSVPTTRVRTKSSKSSGSSSVDLGKMAGTFKWQQPLGQRPSSIDHGHGPHFSGSEPSVAMTKSGPQSHYHPPTDTAPTPVIRGGPSTRDPSSAIPTRAQYPKSQTLALNHKSSTGSLKGNRLKKSRVDAMDRPGLRSSGSRSPEKRRGSESIPPSQPYTNSRAGSRAESRGVSPSGACVELPTSSGHEKAGTAKERPGFFRRVFGSTRQHNYNVNELRHPPPPSIRNSVRADSRSGFTVPDMLHKSIEAEEGNNATPKASHPTVVKKPSSFFRRRKKSVSEPNPAPILPFRLPSHLASNGAAEPNSAGSLRQVMDPFLRSPPSANIDGPRPRDALGSEDTYVPLHSTPQRPSPKRASPRQRSLQDVQKPLNTPDPPRIAASRTRESPNASTIPNLKSDSISLHPPTDSFLHDNSSNEGRSSDLDHNKTAKQADAMPSERAPSSFSGDVACAKDRDPRAQSPKLSPSDRRLRPTRSSNALIKQSGESSNSVADKMTRTPETQELLKAENIPRTDLNPSPAGSAKGSDRVWLQPTKSDEDLHRSSDVSLPIEGAEVSTVGECHPTALVSRLDAHKAAPADAGIEGGKASTSGVDGFEPSAEDREVARGIYNGEESLVEKAKAAAWLGDEGAERARTRRAFMENFEWQNLNILAALRDLCSRLWLKGETQQVDRLLDAFSNRWCACNPNHGFKATDVVHTLCYSLLLLNTDLHMADIEAKMTRAQFLRNTMPTIRRVVADAAPDAFENKRASTVPQNKSWAESPTAERPEPVFPSARSSTEARRSFEGQRPIYRLSSRPSDQSPNAYSSSSALTPLDYDTPADDCGPLVKAPFRGKMSTWEVQIEVVLKNFYNSIRQQRLPNHMAEAEKPAPEASAPVTLSAVTGSMLRRTPSMLSKAGSEHLSFRGRASEQRFATGRWTSKSRQRPRLYPASTVGSSRTSLDEQQSSIWSPAASSTWSKNSFSRTQTSFSVDSFGSSFPDGGYQQSIGFANALSQAIIREEAATGEPVEETMRATPLLEDESLELAGAPWAKEGILKHKHHLEAVDKKCKDRNWVESFAVIEKGCMRLFSFSMNAKSMRSKVRNQKIPGGVVGGGNWMDSAEALGQFSLRQTLASALPPPGYSKSRPHVWALSLPTGAVHLFQVGTPEIVKEFVTTANYWSARLSKEPFVGGVSNIEYGWSGAVINAALIHNDNTPAVSSGANPRPSLQSSIRSSLDQGSSRPKLPGDKITINDWMPPSQSMVASVLMEVDQLRALTAYVKNIEEELSKHNELRPAMLLAFSPRHTNSTKAMANWERKSAYLLREIVKFRTYIDCLQAAQAQKEKIYAERAVPAASKTEEGKEDEASVEKPNNQTTAEATEQEKKQEIVDDEKASVNSSGAGPVDIHT